VKRSSKSQKRIKKSTKPLTVLSAGTREEPSPTKPVLSSVQQKKASYFSYGTFFCCTELREGFVGEDSSCVPIGKTFRDFVGFLSFFRDFELFCPVLEIYGTFFKGSVK
jgi:hypothetical protein